MFYRLELTILVKIVSLFHYFFNQVICMSITFELCVGRMIVNLI